MKKSKILVFIITLLVFPILVGNAKEASINNLENPINNDYEVTFISKKIGKALTKDEVEEQLAKMKTAPTYDELVKLANDNYGMSEATFKILLGWAVNEGYDGAKNLSGEVDHYLGYLCDSVGVNFYMGYGDTTPEALARRFGGTDSSYTVSRLNGKANLAINNPKTYAAQLKGMYLALRYPDERAHDCYGPPVSTQNYYKSRGGSILYQGKAYAGAANYPIQVWTLWYDGIKNWKEGIKTDYDPGAPGGLTGDGDYDSQFSDPRLEYNDICSSGEKGIRDTITLIGKIVYIAIYLIPFIIIVFGMVDFGKAVVANDEKELSKATSKLVKRIVAGLITILVPTLIVALLNVIGITDEESESYNTCLNCLVYPFNDCHK